MDGVDLIKINWEKELDGMCDIFLGIKCVLDEGKIRYWGLLDDMFWGIYVFFIFCKELDMLFLVFI